MLFCTDQTCDDIITQRQFRVYYQQQRGDVNQNCLITSADVIYLVNYVFKGGPPPVPNAEVGNVDCAGPVYANAADIIFLVNYVFKGGAPPLGLCP